MRSINRRNTVKFIFLFFVLIMTAGCVDWGSTYYTEITIANKSSYNLCMKTQYSEDAFDPSFPPEVKIRKNENYHHTIETGLAGGATGPNMGVLKTEFYDDDTGTLLRGLPEGPPYVLTKQEKKTNTDYYLLEITDAMLGKD